MGNGGKLERQRNFKLKAIDLQRPSERSDDCLSISSSSIDKELFVRLGESSFAKQQQPKNKRFPQQEAAAMDWQPSLNISDTAWNVISTKSHFAISIGTIDRGVH